MSAQTLEELLEMKNDQLYYELGQLYIGQSDLEHFNTPTANDIIELGKKHFHDISSKLLPQICKLAIVKTYIRNGQVLETTEIILALIDYLNSVDWVSSLHAPVLAIILIRRGLENLCGEGSNEHKD